MNAITPYLYPPAEAKPFDAKKTITLTLLGGVVAFGVYYFVNRAVKTSRANTSDAKSFQGGSPATTATKINLALTTGSVNGPNVEGLRDTITAIKSKEELDQVKAEYFKQYSKEFNADIKSRVQLSEYDELVAIADAKPVLGKPIPFLKKYQLWAIRIKAAFDKKWLGFDSVDLKALEAVLKDIPTQATFINVGKMYNTLFKDNVMTVIKTKLHSWDVDTYLKMITDKPKGK
jgi:hypothetical protein